MAKHQGHHDYVCDLAGNLPDQVLVNAALDVHLQPDDRLPSGHALTSGGQRTGTPLVGAGGGRTKRISKHRGMNTGAAWSPDGSQIALTLSRDGNPEIYVISASTGQIQRRLTNNRTIDTSFRQDQTLDIELPSYSRTQLHRLTHPPDVLSDQEEQNLLLSRLRVAAVDDNTVSLKVPLGMLKRLEIHCSGFEHPGEAMNHIRNELPGWSSPSGSTI